MERERRTPQQRAPKTPVQQPQQHPPPKKQTSSWRTIILISALCFFVGFIGYLSYSLIHLNKSSCPPPSSVSAGPASCSPDFTKRKQSFMNKYGDIYGYGGLIDEIRKTQMPHLKGQTYVDYTGSGVYQLGQLEAVMKDLKNHLYGNPHSINPSSLASEKVVKDARLEVLRYFEADPNEYTVIFTSGTTASLKMIGETFPWTSNSTFLYTRSNHNSVLGIREYALDKGATFDCIDVSTLMSEYAARTQSELAKTGGTDDTMHLFAYPAECNYSGEKFNLDLIEMFHNGSLGMKKGKYFVLLDAAAFVPTSRLNLTRYHPDFVGISFYKMFGYPSGLGALIIRNEAAQYLRKTFFSGGTVSLSVADDTFYQWMPELCQRFEDGTLPFLSIAALRHGFNALNSVGGIDEITKHCFSLSDYLYNEMRNMKHDSGKPLFEIYGNHSARDMHRQGPILNFNLRDADGEYFGFFDISVLAAEKGIHLRTGCSCNPGACYDFLHVPKSLIKNTVAHIAHNSCGERLDIVSGHPIGSIRVSLGYLTTFEDVENVLAFFKPFLNKTNQQFLDEVALLHN
ncbi:putative molybdenum cofactor sulfurase [Monocercomonoides exilis]|uniref:putative molybdenum cofactor sulfurase n=1 Tax=Monocercomonoides exilis TaxID=2049356 RepID=UPI00355A100C|nr:putative molybdenum cofactor sulfurase [Monocercomonoides exilis]|eukprot:MONOS_10551.1-p1 / transcript=MONOS_10551.1 / gene=MONOS_10551 / organism=Monocercomonoides_exilis_PA203 / gene_product=molybdenum cofactor sulfurase / transcript_product=molybdenum cofactor sulfurase / location=Mono_scaffold00484:13903-16144(+) / protein_length=569 / sequence_SO=supercontig / SO=protein_coding / is_pseudo=false